MMQLNDEKYLGFNDFRFIIIGVMALGLILPIVFFDVKIGDPNTSFFLEWVEACLFATCYWITSRKVMIWWRKKYPSFEMVKKRLIMSSITCIIAVIIVGMIVKPVIIYLFDFLNLKDSHIPNVVQGFGATFTAVFFLLAIYESIWYYSQLKKSIHEQELVKVAHIQSQLDGLRNQVNPHFLFNSLNTLNHIVDYEDKIVAKKFISQLSKVYRYILDSREESIIPLKDELEFVDAYIAIQKERFMDNLQINLEIPKMYYFKKIIPLSLQLLIENAIKHNIISKKKPLIITIDIDTDNETIRVTNNLQKKSKVLHSTKVGLDNIKERYRLIADERPATISQTNSFFRVTLPLLS